MKPKQKDVELLKRFARNFYRMLSIPVRIYCGDKLIESYRTKTPGDPVSENLDKYLGVVASNAKESYIGDMTRGEFLLYGVSRCKKSDIGVVLGPVRTGSITMSTLAQRLGQDDNFVNYKDSLYKVLMNMPILNFDRFRGFVSMLDIYVNNEYVHFKRFECIEDDMENVYKEDLEFSDDIVYRDFSRDAYYEGEKEILFYLRNGMVNQVDDILRNAALNFASDNGDLIRRAKNSVIVGLGVMSREAIRAGVDPKVCFHMVEYFSDKVELSYTFEDLVKIRHNALLYFTEKVEQMDMSGIQSPVIRRVVKYINANVEKHISCKDIAEEFKINRSYVSTCFKQETGIGIVDYINRQKVIEAKKLLKFTDTSLADITYRLSFSSQAYFTKIFKDVVGMTPLEYRESDIN